MMRHLMSLLGGVVLAVGLFWLLAQLVTPPEQEPEELTISMAMTMVEAPEVAPEQEAPPPQPVEAAPLQTPPPMPTPEPPPVTESTISLPAVELPDEPVEPVEMDSELPELAEVEPEPEPAPEPAPEPPPQEAPPEPAPTPRAASSVAESEPGPREAAPAAEPAPSNEPVSVGQATPTSRVNPSYPARAQRRGMEGFVEVAFMIRRDGSVDASSIRITNAQPRRVFDDAAREAIAQWQFESSNQLRNATQRIEFQLR